MEAEPPKIGPPKRKRRWYQFSLRTLMIFTLIVAIPCARVGRKIEQTSTEREAVKAIKMQGAWAHYDYEIAGDEQAGPVWLRTLLGGDAFNDVVQVNDGPTGGLTDDGLEILKRLPQLKFLWLQGDRTTDAGMTHLKALTQLVDLQLTCCLSVSDTGLKNLASLKYLEELNLNQSPISDLGLASLTGLTHLKRLYLSGTGVTDAGVAELQKALPNCKIEH